jgi:hypothetical protein
MSSDTQQSDVLNNGMHGDGHAAPAHGFDLSSHASGRRLDDTLIVNPGQTVHSLSARYIRETEEQWVQRDFR